MAQSSGDRMIDSWRSVDDKLNTFPTNLSKNRLKKTRDKINCVTIFLRGILRLWELFMNIDMRSKLHSIYKKRD